VIIALFVGKSKVKTKFPVMEYLLAKLAEWQKLILKSVLTQRSRLCEKHFDKAINKGNQTATEFVPAVKPRLLSRNVVPTQHLGGNNTSLYYNYCNQW